MANGAPLNQSAAPFPQSQSSKSPASQSGSSNSNPGPSSASSTPIASKPGDVSATSAAADARSKDNAVPAACLACVGVTHIQWQRQPASYNRIGFLFTPRLTRQTAE